MKVGDLVKVRHTVVVLASDITEPDISKRFGIIVETGKWTGNRDIKVLWGNGGIAEIVNSALVIVINSPS